MLSRRWLGILGAALLPASRATCFARNQEPAPAPPPPAASPNPATPPHQRGKQKYSHANDYRQSPGVPGRAAAHPPRH
jgi:hypothetical protein